MTESYWNGNGLDMVYERPMGGGEEGGGFREQDSMGEKPQRGITDVGRRLVGYLWAVKCRLMRRRAQGWNGISTLQAML